MAIPLATVHEDWMFGSVETPKVFVLRSVALLLLSLVALEWATTNRGQTMAGGPAKAWMRRVGLIDHPARSVFVAAAGVLIANLASVAFSPVPTVSITGVDAGTDSYGLLSVSSYVVIFWVTATHLRTGAQLQRLLWAIVAAGVAMSLVGVGQQFNIDLLHNDRVRDVVPMTAGNPIFAGALLSITLPLTLAAFMSLRDRMTPLAHIGIGVAFLGIQLVALVFTLSRGPWVGTAAGLLVLFGTAGWVLGIASLRRPAVTLAILAALALVMGVADPGTRDDAISRFTSIFSSISETGVETLSRRAGIWSSASDAYLSGPWADTERFQEIPDVAPGVLRPLVGYGPNTYQYANFAANGPLFTEHGHNFLVHTAVELGSLGVATYVGMLAALAATLLRMLRRARIVAMPLWHTYAAVGLTAVLAGRLVEQLVGKAQVADLTLSWVLASAVVAMAAMDVGSGSAQAMASQKSSDKRPGQTPRHRMGDRYGWFEQPGRLAGAAVLIVVLAAFWWQSVLPTAGSYVTGASALQSGILGLRDKTIEGYEKAIARSPSVAVNHMALADVLRTLSTVEPSIQGQLSLLTEADEHLQAVVDRNPLDYRARRIQADIRFEMASIDIGLAPGAQASTTTLAALQPGYWGPSIQLARLHLLTNDYEAAADALGRANQLRPSGSFSAELDAQLRALEAALSSAE